MGRSTMWGAGFGAGLAADRGGLPPLLPPEEQGSPPPPGKANALDVWPVASHPEHPTATPAVAASNWREMSLPLDRVEYFMRTPDCPAPVSPRVPWRQHNIQKSSCQHYCLLFST